MENLNLIIAENLVKLRKNAKLTQLEFSEEVKYSDKSISKWEKGESIPNIEVLKFIADYYKITLNDLTDANLDLSENRDIKEMEEKVSKYNKLTVSLLFISSIWIVATTIFVYSELISGSNAWIVFIISVPASFFLGWIFSLLWGTKKTSLILLSSFVWTALATFYIVFLPYNLFAIFFIGVPIQAAILLSGIIKNKEYEIAKKINKMNKKKEKAKKKAEALKKA